jgi:NADH-quinone oxidoreductase subunit K
MIPLSWFLIFSALLFCVGLFGVITRKNAVGMLMGVELMLNSANVNLLAFWRYFYAQSGDMDGLVFTAIVFIVAAAETAVGLALIISAYRRNKTVEAEEMNLLKG